MKKSEKRPLWRLPVVFIILLLAGVLSVLFWRSFLPDYVHFANDGPLGQQVVNWIQLPAAITGMWVDLNDVGFAAGAYTPSISVLIKLVLGPLGYAKFYPVVALFILGLGTWTFFRALKLNDAACVLGALAMTLGSTFLGNACWGVASGEIAIGFNMLALALVLSVTSQTHWLARITRLMLAGLCVGINVIEAADIGALCSLFVAGFVFYRSIIENEPSLGVKILRGIGRVSLIALLAGFIAAQTIFALVTTQIQGIAGTGQDSQTKQERWDWATQWSLPKKETLGLFVPGLFGYKMDTPKDMMPAVADLYEGGVYWGGMGRDPALDRWFDNGSQGTQPSSGFMRFTGGGNYCGILVALIGLWAIGQSLRKKDSAFNREQKLLIWFWTVVMVVSLLLAWGRFAPMFYGLLYKLPYFSTIRNPTKFIIFFTWALVVLFAYGIHALTRQMEAQPLAFNSLSAQLKNWWKRASQFDRRWTLGGIAVFGLCVLGWLLFLSKKAAFVQYLQARGFGDENMAQSIASFSLSQGIWFLILFAVASGLLILAMAGCFNGRRLKTGVVLLGLFLVFDLGRADLPYIVHWDYKQKYEVGSLNPIVDFLAKNPYEHRVAGLPFRAPEGMGLLDQLYRIEWMQHHFPYYNIQCLDLIQMSRMPEDLKAYLTALSPNGTPESVPLLARRWELSNTSYLLGAAGFLDVMNQQLDPQQHRFRIVQRFEIVPKPGILQPTQLEELTAVPDANGRYALFEFTGALPRAKLYSNWQVNTNDAENLKTLANLSFDPAKTVLVSTPEKDLAMSSTHENSGTVEFKSYAPKHIVFAANAVTPAVLLLNDKYDSNWRVTVDGKPAELLRCNFLMRGVQVPPGQHTVEFYFSLPNGPLKITLAAIGVGFGLIGLLIFLSRRKPADQP